MNIFYIVTILLNGFILFIAFLFISQNIKKRILWSFFLLCLGITLWIISIALLELNFYDNLNFILIKIDYIGICIIPFSMMWLMNFIKDRKYFYNKKIMAIAIIPPLLFLMIFIFDFNNLFINSQLYYLFLFYIFAYLTIIFLDVWKFLSYKQISKLEKLAIILWGSVFTVCVLNLILFNYFNPNILFILTVIILFSSILFIMFLILKYFKWNIKIIVTELFVFLTVTALLIQIFLFHSSLLSNLINVFILIIFSFSGYFLVKNIRNEIFLKKKVKKLVSELGEKNTKLQQLDAKKSAFVNMSAHLLRDPLTAIKEHASVLLKGGLGKQTINKKAKKAISNIYDSSHRLVAIIEDFMDISNIEKGTMDYVFEKLDLNEIIKSIFEENKQIINRSELKITYKNEKDKKSYLVEIDEGKIRQVISNLLDNALKYTPKGSVVLQLSKNNDKGVVIFSIKDTGVGLTQKNIQQLFQKFSRADGAQKLHTDGSGLGLFVAMEILKKHNGKIWVESDGVGKGSTFYMELKEEL